MTRRNSILFFGIMWCAHVNAMNIVNTLWPYDTLIRPTFTNDYPWQIALYGEKGFHHAQGYNDDSHRVNVLHIWNAQQNALAMLEGAPKDSPTYQLRSALLDSDNGTRGRFIIDGDLNLDFNFSLATRYFFADDWSIGIYLPFYGMSLTNVTLTDLTPNQDNLDKLVRRLLTDNIVGNAQFLAGLHIGNWKRQGPGDLTILIDWFRDFYQNKPFLQCVRVNWRVGLIVPTGVKENEDLIFAVPFGYDGSFAMPFGLGLDLTLGKHFKCGFDGQLTQIFGNERCRRIKTQENQTELFLFQKTKAYIDYGLVQRFNLYIEFYNFLKGLSFVTGYQYLKRGANDISLLTQEFSTNIANTSPRLEEFTMHHMIIKGTYDFGVHNEDMRARPELSIYGRLPFNGMNSALIPTVGAVFSVDF